MHRLRLSVAGLMAGVALFGLALAALALASPAWSGATLLATLAVLASSALGVAYRRGAGRAWWLGFGLFGWGYAALTLAPWSRPERLPTDALLGRLYVRLSPAEVVAMDPFAASSGSSRGQFTNGRGEAGFMVLDTDPPADARPEIPRGSDAVVTVATMDLAAFRSIGHCLAALLAGCVGGAVGRRFHDSRGPDAE